jgi:ABC-2 type transport system permease protein
MFFLPIIANAIANGMAPLDGATTAEQIRNYTIENSILRISPATLFSESVLMLLSPLTGNLQLNVVSLATTDVSSMLVSPLSLSQSLIQVWPQLVVIIALAIICFAVSYIIFMRQEIRST